MLGFKCVLGTAQGGEWHAWSSGPNYSAPDDHPSHIWHLNRWPLFFVLLALRLPHLFLLPYWAPAHLPSHPLPGSWVQPPHQYHLCYPSPPPPPDSSCSSASGVLMEWSREFLNWPSDASCLGKMSRCLPHGQGRTASSHGTGCQHHQRILL